MYMTFYSITCTLCKDNEIWCELNYIWHQTLNFLWYKRTNVWTTHSVSGRICYSWEIIPKVTLHWYSQKYLHPKLNSYGDTDTSNIIFLWFHILTCLARQVTHTLCMSILEPIAKSSLAATHVLREVLETWTIFMKLVQVSPTWPMSLCHSDVN